jgi:hypothetical protein
VEGAYGGIQIGVTDSCNVEVRVGMHLLCIVVFCGDRHGAQHSIHLGYLYSGALGPGYNRGDILFLTNTSDPIRAGETVVLKVSGRDIRLFHRVITVHEKPDGKVISRFQQSGTATYI